MGPKNIEKEKMLSDELLQKVLCKLGINKPPPTDLDGLSAIYSAWCQKISFDNIRKLIHLESGNPAPLPGDDPIDFFEGWLRFGTGGTCWAGSDALYTLLSSLGFTVYRGIATMLITPHLSPNHGTVIVRFGIQNFLVDTSMLHNVPMLIDTPESGGSGHPARGVIGSWHSGFYHILWRPLHMLDGCTCRIDQVSASHEEFSKMNEKTRVWGPFNYSLYVRLNKGDSVEGIAYGKKVSIDSMGNVDYYSIGAEERNRFLLDEVKIDNELIKRLPSDKPTPRPPGARSQ